MKESKLIQLKNKVDTLGAVLERLIKEQEFLKTIVMGDHRVLKELQEFPAIIEKFKNEQEKDTSRPSSGDSGLTLTDE